MANNYYKITYITDRDKKVSFTIANPNTTLTETEVRQAMNGMMASPVISSIDGNLVDTYAAELVTVSETKLV